MKKMNLSKNTKNIRLSVEASKDNRECSSGMAPTLSNNKGRALSTKPWKFFLKSDSKTARC